jgi:uncharacterized membrane protein
MTLVREISVNMVIVFVVIILLELFYLYKVNTKPIDLNMIDTDHNKVITRQELAHYMKKSKWHLDGVMSSIAIGATRGALMGLIVGGGLDSAIAGAVTLGIVNPVMVMIEAHIT